ncbi:MAG: hypothetical protein E7396_05695 [Ruminococcaceae bacterium]|nr:hypothetical protein [Oscillospiraceae bacterium]
MKVCIIQPEYSVDYERADELFYKQCELMDRCDDSIDIIVLPELCDVPVLASTKEKSEALSEKFHEPLLKKAKETAKRCNSILFFNGREKFDDGLRNTTFAIDRSGNIAGTYYKEHLVPKEVSVQKLDSKYSFEPSFPTVIEIEGIRFGFLTCYDFYFYENFAHIARYNLDVIIGCSHQRSDTHSAIEIITRFLAYNTNAYVLRSSVSMDVNSDIGGGSMVVSPKGDVLLNMKSRIGLETVDIDIKDKYFKPAGFGNPPAAHYEYIEEGRRPWKYRPSGSFIVPNDDIMPYPRLCAHRGFNTVAPENSMPAFGAAISLGAEEIEFDLYEIADGEIVSIHDHTIDRVADGEGIVYEKTYEELLEYDFGVKHNQAFKGLNIIKFEEILKKFACHCIMNIHIKSRKDLYFPSDEGLNKIIDLIRKYDCTKHVYFMTGDEKLIQKLKSLAPDIAICCGAGGDAWGIVDKAIRNGCKKLQFFKDQFDQGMIDKAKANGIICNAFFADDEEKAIRYLRMGIDTILTNDYLKISNIVKEYLKGDK